MAVIFSAPSAHWARPEDELQERPPGRHRGPTRPGTGLIRKPADARARRPGLSQTGPGRLANAAGCVSGADYDPPGGSARWLPERHRNVAQRSRLAQQALPRLSSDRVFGKRSAIRIATLLLTDHHFMDLIDARRHTAGRASASVFTRAALLKCRLFATALANVIAGVCPCIGPPF